MRGLFGRFRRDERGPTAVEYAVLTIFIALVIMVGANVLGANLNTLFGKAGAEFSHVPPIPPTP